MKNKNIFIQVGMPKTGTTTLQREVFPLLCKYTKYTYWRDNIDLLQNVNIEKYNIHRGFAINPINLPEYTLISLESLIPHDPRLWEESVIGNKKLFGEDAHILIVLRNPRSFLSSIYTEICLHTGRRQLPEHFFLSSSEYSERHIAPIFSIDDFNYNDLIKFYRDQFKKVTILKFEELPKLEFIDDFFDINKKQLKYMQTMFQKKIHNRRFSFQMVKLLFFITKGIDLFGLSLGAHFNNETINLVRNPNYKYPEIIITKKQKIKQKIKEIIKKIMRKFNWHTLFMIIDKLFGFKKFELDFDKLNYIDINKLEKDYSKIPNYKTYIRD